VCVCVRVVTLQAGPTTQLVSVVMLYR